jgi:hypothetical protein
MCGDVACVSDCHGSVREGTTTLRHTDQVTSHLICISSNSQGAKKLPDDGRLLLKHVGASVWNKGVVQSVHIICHFYYPADKFRVLF